MLPVSSATIRVPSTRTPYPVSAEQASDYQRNGHILLRDVLPSGETITVREAVTEAVRKYSKERRSLEDRDTYGKAFLQVTNLWEVNEAVKDFVFARRFAQIAADLMGVEKVRLYHDQALYKEPRGGRTPWHQDKFYWNLDTDHMITMWMPLVDVSEEMGTMAFASGSHKMGMARNVHISDESEIIYEKYIEENNFPVHQVGSMRAGDATFHHGWMVHSAGENKSEHTTREVMTIIYFADGAKITKPVNEFQKADHARWLSGIEPGKIADGILNPIL